MSADRELLDLFGAYSEARKGELVSRVRPPEVSVDEHAERAMAKLEELIDSRVKAAIDAALPKMAKAAEESFNQQARGQ